MLHAEDVEKYLIDFKLSLQSSLLPSTVHPTSIKEHNLGDTKVKHFINEYWTSRQRQASSLQEISYRACFKPQLPRFFIDLLTNEGDVVYDPFSGRGTTPVEAGLARRRAIANDINPLSRILAAPRLQPPILAEVEERLRQLPFNNNSKADIDLSMFYHPCTEGEIVSLKNYLMEAAQQNKEDHIDRWIRMVATNRLTGHSKGFFSVYTLPPNQATSPERQVKINQQREQKPDYRDTKGLIYKKAKSLLRKITQSEINNLKEASGKALFLEKDARDTGEIPDLSVQLTVTSPPFLDVVQYSNDNWLRCWFNNIDVSSTEKSITMARTIEEWSLVMEGVFLELYRITKKGGWVAFEVGEVKHKKIKLDDYVVPMGLKAGFNCLGVVINRQEFTKTSNIWGVKNNKGGTNSNRIVLFQKQ